MKLFVDMDCVLVDFNRAVCPVFGLDYPAQSVLTWDWSYQQSGLSVDAYIDQLGQDPKFWSDMHPCVWMPELVQILDHLAPEWHILTAATQEPSSWHGKADWVRRYFREKGMYRLVMLHGDKQRIASRDSILIDDRVDHCMRWREAGGIAFHWVEFTRDHREMWEPQLERLRQFLTDHLIPG